MRKLHHGLCAFMLFTLFACGGGETAEQLAALAAAQLSAPSSDAAQPGDAEDAREEALALARRHREPPRVTSLTLRIDDLPIPVKGSDGRFHIVYDIEVANLTGDKVTVHQVEVLDARNGMSLAVFNTTEVAQRLVVRDKDALPGGLRASQLGLLYLHVGFDNTAAIPRAIEHRVSLVTKTMPSAFTAGRTKVARATDLVFDAPLRGARYIAGDGCCDSTRHIRASLALNGSLFNAQRLAIDWERLDAQGRIYVGDPKDPRSYIIYGEPAYAVADARVVTAVDGLPDTPTGSFPVGIPIEQADGNHVVLDLGDGRFALYAHFKPNTVRVSTGQLVRRGQLLGLVGTSGNSSEPHLHFQVMDGPSTFASNGVPYLLRRFSATHRGASTAAFDQAIIDGLPLPTEPVAGPARRGRVLPLDLWIVDFPE